MNAESPGLAPEIRAALCHQWVRRFLPGSPEAYPELYDACIAALTAAARLWEPSKGRFLTFAYPRVRFAVLRIRGRETRLCDLKHQMRREAVHESCPVFDPTQDDVREAVASLPTKKRRAVERILSGQPNRRWEKEAALAALKSKLESGYGSEASGIH